MLHVISQILYNTPDLVNDQLLDIALRPTLKIQKIRILASGTRRPGRYIHCLCAVFHTAVPLPFQKRILTGRYAECVRDNLHDSV